MIRGGTIEVDGLGITLLPGAAAGRPGVHHVEIGGVPREVRVLRAGTGVLVGIGAREYRVVPAPRTAGDDGTRGIFVVRAFMPGKIVAIRVAPGGVVEKGTPLLVLEAMKMQNEVIAPRPGRVERILVRPGENVVPGSALVELGPLTG